MTSTRCWNAAEADCSLQRMYRLAIVEHAQEPSPKFVIRVVVAEEDRSIEPTELRSRLMRWIPSTRRTETLECQHRRGPAFVNGRSNSNKTIPPSTHSLR